MAMEIRDREERAMAIMREPAPPPVVALPGLEEFRTLERMAGSLAQTTFVPKAYQGKPHEVMACMLTAREVGIGPMAALRHISNINGKPVMSAELMVALVRRAKHRIWVDEEPSPEKATVYGQRRGEAKIHLATFTIEDAQRAGLLAKDVWKQYPRSMIWARSVSQLCREAFPDVLAGVSYTAEELGAEVDEDGQVVDVPAEMPRSRADAAATPTEVFQGQAEVVEESVGRGPDRQPGNQVAPMPPTAEQRPLKVPPVPGRESRSPLTDAEIQRLRYWVDRASSVNFDDLERESHRACGTAISEPLQVRHYAAILRAAQQHPLPAVGGQR